MHHVGAHFQPVVHKMVQFSRFCGACAGYRRKGFMFFVRKAMRFPAGIAPVCLFFWVLFSLLLTGDLLALEVQSGGGEQHIDANQNTTVSFSGDAQDGDSLTVDTGVTCSGTSSDNGLLNIWDEWRIVNNGTVSVSDDNGISFSNSTTGNELINNGTVNAADQYAINLGNSISDTQVTNSLSGLISAGNYYGIYLGSGALECNINNVGNISVLNSYGIYFAAAAQNCQVSNSGAITVTNFDRGISFLDTARGNTIDNSGTLNVGRDFGIYLGTSAIENQITNFGAINVADDYGIYFGNSAIDNHVTNSGTISVADVYGLYFANTALRNVIQNDGIINVGSSYGLRLGSDSAENVITNNGTVSVVGSYGIYLNGNALGNTIVNNGLIDVIGNTAVTLGSGARDNTITNTNQITVGGSIGISLGSSSRNNTINNLGSITLSTGSSGITMGTSSQDNLIFNAGSISTGNDYAVYFGSSTASNTLQNSGSLHANDDYAVFFGNNCLSNTINNTGSISTGDVFGIYFGSGAQGNTINNSGTLLSENDYGIYIYDNAQNNLIINNVNGTIRATDNTAIYFRNYAVGNTIINNGRILAGGSSGIYISNGDNNIITNNGVIDVVATNGVFFGNGDGNLLVNTGIIRAGTGVGVRMSSGAGSNTLTNSGMIIGGGGTSVDMASGDDILNVLPGASFIGNINGGADNDTLNFDLGAASFVFSDDVLNFENVNLNSGTVRLDGVLGSAEVTVSNGATLAAGDNIGVLSISGNYSEEAGGNLEIQVFGPGISDLLTISGQASLGGNLLVLTESNLADGATMTFLTAGAGINGIFDSISGSAVLGYSLQYGANQVDLIVNRNSYASFGDLEAGKSLGEMLDEVVASAGGELNQLIEALNSLVEADGVSLALRQASHCPMSTMFRDSVRGTEHATGRILRRLRDQRLGLCGLVKPKEKSQADDSFLASAVTDPVIFASLLNTKKVNSRSFGLQDYDPSKANGCFFARSFGLFIDQESNGDLVGYQADSTGISLGLDFRVSPEWVVGAAVEFARTDFSWEDFFGDSEVDSLRLTSFASYFKKSWHIDAAVGLGFNDYDNTRFTGLTAQTAVGSYGGRELFCYLGGGRSFDLGRKLAIEPLLGVQYTRLNQDGYTETGAGSENMTVDDLVADSLSTTLGLRLSSQINLSWGYLIPAISGRWKHEFFDDDVATSAMLQGAPGLDFTVHAASSEQNSALLGLGLTALIRERCSLKLHLESEIQNETSTLAISVGVGLSF